MSSAWQEDRQRPFRRYSSRVPEITASFWIVAVLATAVGDMADDLLIDTLGPGLSITTTTMLTLLASVLVVQMSMARYNRRLYWFAVVLISIVGTLVTDNLVVIFGVSTPAATVAFTVLFGATFAIWYAAEKTLSIHTIDTARRLAFYWLAILFAFALGSAATGFAAEAFGPHYGIVSLASAALIAAVWIAWRLLGLGALLAFWLAYVALRPFGASLGDLLTRPVSAGGLGLGPLVTGAVLLAGILFAVHHLGATDGDQPTLDRATRRAGPT